MVNLLMGIDIGTFETKGVLVDETGVMRVTSRCRHGISQPAAGHVEQDADNVWWHDVVVVARDLISQVESSDVIVGVGCSAIGPCVLPIDENLQALRPGILYGVDTRAGNEIAEIRKALGDEEILARSGNTMTSQSAGPKMLWIERNEPDVAKIARWYVTSQSYIVARLTGQVVIDHATAGYTHPFYRLAETRYDTDGIENLVPASKLPPLAWSSDVVGVVSDEASKVTSIPAGTPVVAGTTDSPAEALGASVAHPGDVMVQIGSTGYIINVTREPSPSDLLWSAPWVLRDSFVLAAGTSTAGTATRWIADQLQLDQGDGDEGLFSRLMDLNHASPPGANGVLHIPHFSGERTPYHDPDARAAFVGLGLDTKRADLARSVSEGIAHSIALAVETLIARSPNLTRIVAVGGGTKNDVIMQTLADVLDMQIEIADCLGAAYGDAILAGIGTGLLKPGDTTSWFKTKSVVASGPSGSTAVSQIRRQHTEYQRVYEGLAWARTRTDGVLE